MTPILLIDDDPTARLIVTRTLKQQGYDVAVAKNGQEGIDLAKIVSILSSLSVTG